MSPAPKPARREDGRLVPSWRPKRQISQAVLDAFFGAGHEQPQEGRSGTGERPAEPRQRGRRSSR